MSLTEISLASNTKKLYQYKLKSYIWVFNSLIILQLLAVLFSLGGTGSTGRGTEGIFVSVNFYSADVSIAFTMLWAFIISTQITSTIYKEKEFLFVMNKTSNTLSDAVFLLTTSIVGGITALLSGYLIKVVMYFVFNATDIIRADLLSGPKYLLIGIFATILFVFLCSALGYLVGMLAQLNRIFIVLLPVLFIGSLYIADKYGENNFMFTLFEFYFQEASILIFILKIVVTVVLFFTGALIISNRLEVRQ